MYFSYHVQWTIILMITKKIKKSLLTHSKQIAIYKLKFKKKKNY